jgi:hypothetical protein
MNKPHPPECITCGADFPERRAALGYNTCLDCGDFAAREVRMGWCIAPIAHKQGATLVTKKSDLRGLNKVVPWEN